MTTRTKGKTKRPAKPAAKPDSGANRTPILIIAFGVIAALLIAAIVLSSDEPIGSAGEFGEPTVNGSSLPVMASGVSVVESDPATGAVAPEVSGQDFDDSVVEINHDGTPKAVVFLAHWCQHCQAEVPAVQSWLDGGGGVEGVDIVTVTTSASSGQPNWPPSSWLEREGWTSPTIRDDQASSVFQAYGGRSYPYWVFLNGDGTVAFRLAGRQDISTLELVMESLQPTG